MIYLKVCLLIIGAIILLRFFFPVCFINGESMTPTLKPGSYVLATRLFSVPKLGGVYIVRSQMDKKRLVIKRLSKIKAVDNNSEMVYFFIGDNKEKSFDSRNWGYVPRKDILAKVIFPQCRPTIEKGDNKA